MTVNDLLILAAEEGLPPEHIASQLAVPLAIVFFCGSVVILLWSIYGLKKGALVYGVALFGFTFVLGVFWWFGAPGTPIATGLRNFPGQPVDQYEAKWFPFEPGSERAGFFPATANFESFVTPERYLGLDRLTGEELEDQPKFTALRGDLDAASGRMLAHYLPTDEFGTPLLGRERRSAINEAAGAPQEGEIQDSPFLTARVALDADDRPLLRVIDDRGHRVAAAQVEMVGTYVSTGPDGAPVRREVVVEERTWYAFKDPGAVWFPSAVWTFASLALFGLCLFGLDRIEQREKRRGVEVEEPVRERTPVGAG